MSLRTNLIIQAILILAKGAGIGWGLFPPEFVESIDMVVHGLQGLGTVAAAMRNPDGTPIVKP